jgi:AraC-like DNA-binding protein
MQDRHFIQEMERAFSKPVANGVVELDNLLFNRSSFNVLRLEELYVKTKGIIPPYRQSDHFIVFVKQGTGKRSIGQYTFTIQDNSLAVVPRKIIHTATYTSKPEGYLICFSADFFVQQAFSFDLLNKRKVLKSSSQHFMLLHAEQAQEISGIFEKIIEECNSHFEERKQMIALKILELLIMCDRLFKENISRDCTASSPDLLQRFNELIEDNFAEHRNVQFYAEVLHTHPNNLNQLVKKATGLTAKQTINKRLVLEAKSLLVSTALSIKEIAYKLGFEDPNYFISFFKKEQHATPAHYRTEPV